MIESQIHVTAPSFKALMIQPHHEAKESTKQPTWKTLHELTLKTLKKQGEVELILWPEGAVPGGNLHELASDSKTLSDKANSNFMSLSRFRAELLPQYGTNCLAGTSLSCNGIAIIGKVSYPAICNYNCGCLFTKSGQVDAHEKISLMPIRETVPNWFNWFPQIRKWILSEENLASRYQPGRNFHPLTFQDRNGVTRKIAVAICYESWLPWLPQYHCQEPLDAICHLAYDGDFKDHPEYTQRMLLTIRLRAIETRTWQLVCTHFSGTAVIDPRGRIVKQLPPGPGVLRTDEL
ncbi:MAG: hypothetical protein KF752_05135 [Pirellulaceae bacterium]|nr:hypothetical protein [Pirellulaceae bacterium]